MGSRDIFNLTDAEDVYSISAGDTTLHAAIHDVQAPNEIDKLSKEVKSAFQQLLDNGVHKTEYAQHLDSATRKRFTLLKLILAGLEAERAAMGKDINSEKRSPALQGEVHSDSIRTELYNDLISSFNSIIVDKISYKELQNRKSKMLSNPLPQTEYLRDYFFQVEVVYAFKEILQQRMDEMKTRILLTDWKVKNWWGKEISGTPDYIGKIDKLLKELERDKSSHLNDIYGFGPIIRKYGELLALLQEAKSANTNSRLKDTVSFYDESYLSFSGLQFSNALERIKQRQPELDLYTLPQPSAPSLVYPPIQASSIPSFQPEGCQYLYYYANPPELNPLYGTVESTSAIADRVPDEPPPSYSSIVSARTRNIVSPILSVNAGNELQHQYPAYWHLGYQDFEAEKRRIEIPNPSPALVSQTTTTTSSTQRTTVSEIDGIKDKPAQQKGSSKFSTPSSFCFDEVTNEIFNEDKSSLTPKGKSVSLAAQSSLFGDSAKSSTSTTRKEPEKKTKVKFSYGRKLEYAS